MNSLNDYLLEQAFFENPRCIFYKGKRKSDQMPVVIKKLKGDFYTPHQLAQFAYEFKIASLLPKEHFIRYHQLIKTEGSLALILEDIGGESLALLYGQKKNMPFLLFFKIALPLTRGIAEMHSRQVIHKDINPSNIIYNPHSNVLKITDFGISTTLKSEKLEMAHVGEGSAKDQRDVEGTLAYLSPEQTGRINRVVDYRTDFYALGITFYQLLTGQLPFTMVDVGELIHAQIARRPPPPEQINPQIHPVLSEIILKLMAKSADDRYQSAEGLLFDLEECQQQYDQKKTILPFKLGQNDYPLGLRIPSKLYGRQQDINYLVEIIKKTLQHSGCVALVKGYSGVGKSSLVHVVCESLDENVYLIQGKFDQLRRSVAYSAITQAFNSLIEQISMESSEKRLGWKQALTAALGEYTGLMIELIPALETILEAPIPLKTPLAPAENLARFQNAFSQLISLFATATHPLILFLDDLQWADQASLNLLADVIINRRPAHMLIMGAYRDNEVDALHPLELTIDKMRQAGCEVHTITLHPLALEDTAQLLVDTLRTDIKQILELAQLCQKKTRGNPFYLTQFLKTLEVEQLLTFQNKQWHWDLEEIDKREVSTNVVDLLIKELQTLPEGSQLLIQFAACIGYRFTLEILSTILTKSLQETSHLLQPLLEKMLILPLDSSYRTMENEANPQASFRFLHDRVQQAAYREIDEERKKSTHLTIGRLLRDTLKEKKLEEQLCDLVEHLNRGKDLIQDEEERVSLARLNLRAGMYAKQANAYHLAQNYFKTGLQLLSGPENWSLKSALTYAYGEALYLTSDFDASIAVLKPLLKESQTLKEKAGIYQILVDIETLHSHNEEAISLGLEALELLKTPLKAHPNMVDILLEFLKAKWKLRGKSIEKLLHAEEIRDEILLTTLSLLNALFISTAVSNTNLCALVCLRTLNLTLTYGNSLSACMGYLGYAMSLCNSLDIDPKQEEEAYGFGQLVAQLIERNPHFSTGPHYLFVYLAGFYYRRHSFQECVLQLEENYLYALNVNEGAHPVIASILFFNIVARILSGQLLLEVLPRAEAAIMFNQKVQDRASLLSLVWARCYCQALIFNDEKSWCFEENDESALVEIMEKELLERPKSSYYLMKSEAEYRLDNFTSALEVQEKLIKEFIKPKRMLSFFCMVCFYFYYPLTLAALYEKADPSLKKKYLKEMKAYLTILEHRAQTNPENHANKYLIVRAELARVQGNPLEAIINYNLAIEKGQQYQLPHENALAHELAGKLYLSIGDRSAAKGHLIASRHLYELWGAKAKVEKMQQQFGSYMGELSGSTLTHTLIGTIVTASTTSNTTSSSLGQLDFTALLEASQSISGEIELPKLLSIILHIMVKNSGAQTGTILLEKSSRLFIEGHLSADNQLAHLLASVPLEASSLVPHSLIDFVYRTKQQVLLNDAREKNPFSKDPYIESHQPKSILAMPIIQTGQINGILYLENNLTENVFTNERLATLSALASQVSISTENARLYQAFEHFVPKAFLSLLEKKSIIDITLGDNTQKVFSILFTDIQGFSSLSEKVGSSAIFAILNEGLKYMEPEILKNKGFIDKYIGDAILAIFPEKADDAVLAAIGIQRALHAFNQNQRATGKQEIKVGAGISTGLTQFGIVGAEQRMDITVISDTANSASRIESLTRHYGVWILISHYTLEACLHPQQFQFRELDLVRVKGRDEPIRLIEVIDGLPEQEQKIRVHLAATFQTARLLYRGENFQKALQLFEECRVQDPTDKTYQIYIERCQNLLLEGVPAGWQGVWEFMHK